jgi:prolyl oligopeptidase
MSSTITYPSIRRDPSVTDSYGDKSSSAVTINDPYRWLEDPDSEETTQFVSDQNVISQDYLKQIPYRTKFFEHLKEVFNIPKFSCPSKQPNGKYYYFMNTGLQNQDVYYELDSLSQSTDQAKILLDPNTFSEDGTVAIQSLNFSFDGKTMCYSVSDAGSDWSTIYFMDVASRTKLDDVIIRTKFSSLRWTTDNRGIFYATYAGALDNTPSNNDSTTSTDKKNKDEEEKIEVTRTDIQEVYFHRLGTPRSSDICLARCIDDLAEHFFSVQTSDDGQYLIASISKGTLTESKLWFLSLSNSSDSIIEQPTWSKLIDNMDFVYDFVTSQGDLLYLKTNAQAENFRLITINTKTKEIKEIISEDKHNLLEDVTRVYDKYFVVRYLSHVKSVLYLYEMESGRQLRKFDLPIGNISVW